MTRDAKNQIRNYIDAAIISLTRGQEIACGTVYTDDGKEVLDKVSGALMALKDAKIAVNMAEVDS